MAQVAWSLRIHPCGQHRRHRRVQPQTGRTGPRAALPRRRRQHARGGRAPGPQARETVPEAVLRLRAAISHMHSLSKRLKRIRAILGHRQFRNAARFKTT